ncbi:MAG: hypothetical protein K0Q73_6318 [Paenibacillus sp.]|nr:hypothetical protein [Paenibacillus sp.]
MSKAASRSVTVCILLSMLLSGCAGGMKSKTVIIPDTEASSEPDKVNEDFTVNKIYTLPDTGFASRDGSCARCEGDMNSSIVGWMDKNQLLGAYGRELDLSLERVDYKFNSRQQLMDVKKNARGVNISPDGSHIIYLAIEDFKPILKLLNLANNVETVIQEYVFAPFLYDPVSWSNNSQYAAYGKGDEKGRAGSLIAYDIVDKSAKEYQVPAWSIKEMSLGYKISDDGESALIIKLSNGQYNLVFGQLKGNEFISQFEQPISLDGGFDYINDDQILFTSLGGALNMFDTRNATTITLLESVGGFQLSKDRKYIAYSKDQDEIFVAKIQGNNVINEKSIYKGLIPVQMQWSPDNKKILLTGRKLYSREKSAPAAIVAIDLPFIIEFK